MADVGETDKKQKAEKIPLLYGDFEAGEELFKKLVDDVRPDLALVNIKFVCRNVAKKRNKKPLGGSVYKVNPMYKYLVNCDFIVEVALEVWNVINPQQRVALIDHLLMRIDVEENDESGVAKLSLRAPDIQEFAEIIQRHHAWNEDLVELESISDPQ